MWNYGHCPIFIAPMSGCRPLSARMSDFITLQLGRSHRFNQACNHTIATNNKWKCVLWSICMSWKQNNVGTRCNTNSMITLFTGALKAGPLINSSLPCENLHVDTSLLPSGTAEKKGSREILVFRELELHCITSVLIRLRGQKLLSVCSWTESHHLTGHTGVDHKKWATISYSRHKPDWLSLYRKLYRLNRIRVILAATQKLVELTQNYRSVYLRSTSSYFEVEIGKQIAY